MLQLKETPRFARNDRVMTHTKHEQGVHGEAHGCLTAMLVPTDLVAPQPQPDFSSQFRLSLAQRFCERHTTGRDGNAARVVSRILVCVGPRWRPLLLRPTVTAPL